MTDKVIATAFSVVVGVASNRQITFNSGFEGDEPIEQVNARLDQMMALADRQAARYEIDDIQVEIDKAADTLSQLNEDRARVQIDHEHNQARRRVELEERTKLRKEARAAFEATMNADMLEVQDNKAAEMKAGQEEHQRSGRMSPYRPAGNRLRSIALCDEALAKMAARRDLELVGWDADYDRSLEVAQSEIDKADAEARQTEANLDISVRRHTEFLEGANARLAKAKATAGL